MAVLGSDNITHSTDFKFNINSADRVTIDSSGRLGVGTTIPADSLTVVGAASIHQTSIGANNKLIFANANNACAIGPSDLTNSLGFSFYTAGGGTIETARINASGDFLIGGTLPSAPNITLASTGNIIAAGTVRDRTYLTDAVQGTASRTYRIAVPITFRAPIFVMAGYQGGGASSTIRGVQVFGCFFSPGGITGEFVEFNRASRTPATFGDVTFTAGTAVLDITKTAGGTAGGMNFCIKVFGHDGVTITVL